MGGREKSYITFEKSYSAPDLPMVVVGKCMGVLALYMVGREESYITFEKSYIAPDLPMVVVGKCMGVLALCMGGSNSKGEGELPFPCYLLISPDRSFIQLNSKRLKLIRSPGKLTGGWRNRKKRRKGLHLDGIAVELQNPQPAIAAVAMPAAP